MNDILRFWIVLREKSASADDLLYRVGSLFLTVLDLSSILRFIYIYSSKSLSYVTFCMVLECASVAEHWSSNVSSNVLA